MPEHVFAEARTELRWLIRDGIDAALEFATLGEYRLTDDRPGPTVAVDAHAATDVRERSRGECGGNLGVTHAATMPRALSSRLNQPVG